MSFFVSASLNAYFMNVYTVVEHNAFQIPHFLLKLHKILFFLTEFYISILSSQYLFMV